MGNTHRFILACLLLLLAPFVYGQEQNDSVYGQDQQMQEVAVSTKQDRHMKSRITNTELISSGQLLRAACCNLGESFTTNPSVDVSYNDAATGSEQIRLLGLSGKYVQMLTENVPNYRGASMPFALDFIPGPWMHSIQVSKGTSSVKNGYEAIAGQINVEYKKSQAEQEVFANAYLDTELRYELNANANIHLSDKWSTMLLAHFDHLFMAHDENGDGFLDMPKNRQWNVMWRTAYMSDRFISQFGVKALGQKRMAGQDEKCVSNPSGPLYRIGINTNRYEAFAKNAYIFNQEHNTNLALILSGSIHKQDAYFGDRALGASLSNRALDVNQKNGYASLMFETEPNEHHAISLGVSYNVDDFRVLPLSWESGRTEHVPGAYAQYTYKLGETLSAQAGVRIDHSTLHGTFFTPRAHVKWSPLQWLTLRTSAGKGYRTNHPLVENCFLLASSRKIVVDNDLQQEEAWNTGVSAQMEIPIGSKTLSLNTEYYYTHFIKQLVIDMDSDPHAVHFTNLQGASRSHTFQVDASYPFFKGFDLMAAFRLTDVKQTIGGQLREMPLTSRFKGLVTASYKTPLDIWQFDVTLQVNGGGRLPDSYLTSEGKPSWESTFNTYPQLSAQITRDFRRFSVYVGGENLTDFVQEHPVVCADRPFSDNFDATVAWGPIDGWMLYAGLRFKMDFIK